jgi:(p)ppGpp synthase/HD superfamily hydrolase
VHLSPTFEAAFAYAWHLHGGETRKGGDVPYMAHVISVSALVLQHGGDETQAVAGLLHDTAEDHGGESRLSDIDAHFGAEVAEIVRQCSDSLVADRSDKPPWWPRKVGYVHQLANHPAGSPSLLVAAADKYDNARSLLTDYRLVGEELWSRFNRTSGRAGQLWYYGRLAELLTDRLGSEPRALALAHDLSATVTALRDSIVSAGAADLDTLERELELARQRERELTTSPAG